MRAAAPGHQDRHRVVDVGRETKRIEITDGNGARLGLAWLDSAPLRITDVRARVFEQ